MEKKMQTPYQISPLFFHLHINLEGFKSFFNFFIKPEKLFKYYLLQELKEICIS